jgi:uncharacterized membrane protein
MKRFEQSRNSCSFSAQRIGTFAVSFLAVSTLFAVSASASTLSPTPSTTPSGQANDSAAPRAKTEALGVSPGSLNLRNGARNGSTVSDVSILNTTTQSQTFTAIAKGDIAKWTRFGPQGSAAKELSVEAKPGATAIRVQIDIPADAANGSYTGAIYLNSTPDPKNATGVSVSFEIPVGLDVNGDQVIAATYSNLSVTASEIGKPATMKMTVANTGNVALPVTAFAEIKRGDAIVDKVDSAQSSQTIDPGTSGDILLDWVTKDALPGDYSITVSLEAPGVKLGSKTQTIRLEAAGALVRSAQVDSLAVTTEKGVATAVTGSLLNNGKVAGQTVARVRFLKGDTEVAKATSEAVYLAPGQTSDFTIAIPQDLQPGSYTAQVTAELDGVRSKPELLKFSAGKSSSSTRFLFLLGLIPVGLLLFMLRRRSSEPKQNNTSTETQPGSGSKPRAAYSQPIDLTEIPAKHLTNR